MALGRAPPGDELGQEALVDDWLAAIAREQTGLVTLEGGIADLAVVDSAYRLARAPSRS